MQGWGDHGEEGQCRGDGGRGSARVTMGRRVSAGVMEGGAVQG